MEKHNAVRTERVLLVEYAVMANHSADTNGATLGRNGLRGHWSSALKGLNPEAKKILKFPYSKSELPPSCFCSLVRVEAESVMQGACATAYLRHWEILNGTSVIRDVLTGFLKTNNCEGNSFRGRPP